MVARIPGSGPVVSQLRQARTQHGGTRQPAEARAYPDDFAEVIPHVIFAEAVDMPQAGNGGRASQPAEAGAAGMPSRAQLGGVSSGQVWLLRPATVRGVSNGLNSHHDCCHGGMNDRPPSMFTQAKSWCPRRDYQRMGPGVTSGFPRAVW